MKKQLFGLWVALLLANSLAAQTKGFSYQSFVIDLDGRPVNQQAVDIRFGIYVDGSGSMLYSEEHQCTTDTMGIFTLEIGSVDPTAFNALNFAQANLKLKVEARKTGNATYKSLSDSWLMSVPYAKTATRALTAKNGPAVGTIMTWVGPLATIPTGWWECDGRLVAQANYPKLYTAIGSSWGVSGSSFYIPDMRGQFPRGVDGTAGQDPDKNSRTARYSGGNTGNNVGSYQGQEFGVHNHGVSDPGHSHVWQDWRVYSTGNGPDETSREGLKEGGNVGEGTSHVYTGISLNANGGNETRPRNANVYYIIKFE